MPIVAPSTSAYCVIQQVFHTTSEANGRSLDLFTVARNAGPISFRAMRNSRNRPHYSAYFSASLVNESRCNLVFRSQSYYLGYINVQTEVLALSFSDRFQVCLKPLELGAKLWIPVSIFLGRGCISPIKFSGGIEGGGG